METTKLTSSPLPGIRTLGSDLAASAKKQEPTSASGTNPVPKPEKVAPENFVYQAPRHISQPKQPIPKPIKPPPKPTPAKPLPMAPETEPVLKPLTTPKRTGEPTFIVDNEDAATATIIRDTKRNRFHLFPAVFTSLHTWASSLKDRYFTKKPPKYTVPETTRRKGVIQRATSKTGKIATFDAASLQERVRARRDRTVPKAPITIWTANTEPGFPLLEAPDTLAPSRITNVRIEPKKSKFVIPNTPVSILSPKPNLIIASETEPVIPSAAMATPSVTSPAPVTPSVVISSPLTTRQPMPPPATSVPLESSLMPAIPTSVNVYPKDVFPSADIPSVVASITNVPPSTAKVKPITTLKPNNLRDWLFSLDTNTISVGALLIVGSISLVLFISYHRITALSSEPTVIDASSPSRLLAEKLQLLSAPTLSPTELSALIRQQTGSSPYRTFEVAITFDTAGQPPLPPSSVFAGMKWAADQTLIQSITAIRFGALEQNTPFIVMKVTNEASARGGLLAWEARLFDDLSTLFLLPYPKPELAKGFTDIVVDKNDARRLSDSIGQDLLIYTIIDNLIIITTNETALRNLITSRPS